MDSSPIVPFSHKELSNTVQSHVNNKALGIDGIRAEAVVDLGEGYKSAVTQGEKV